MFHCELSVIVEVPGDEPGKCGTYVRAAALPFAPFPGLLLKEITPHAVLQVHSAIWSVRSKLFECSLVRVVLPRRGMILHDVLGPDWTRIDEGK